MARIPDSTDLGERVAPRRRVPEVTNNAAQIRSAALGQAADAVGNLARVRQAHDDEFNYARAKNALLQADAAMQKQFEDDPDWATQETRYTESMRQARESASKMIQGGRSRAAFDLDADANILRGTEGVRTNAKRVEGQWGRSTLDETLDSNRRAALESKDPAARGALITGSLDAIRGAVSKGYINPEQATQVEQAWKSNYGEGFVEVQSDAEQMRLLKKPKGTPADFIDPAKRAALLDRLTEKQRVAVDRREAKAERAMAQWERQTASGVPPTAESRKEWSDAIQGTSVQGELNNLLAGEAEVQKTLKMPLADQVRLVQEREAKLYKEGGTVADQANVNRLKTAVQTGLKLLSTSPLQYAEERLNEPNVQLDVGTMLDPSSHAETAATFQERATQLRTLGKRFQTNVPMKPLLPQEQQELTRLLEGASPKQAADLFATLREATGSPDVFKGAMQQLVPDAPVKAMAGILAAQQRDAVVSDRTLAGRDVAATMLRGESILSPSKAEKTEDGKAKGSKLFFPQAAQTDLQTKFSDIVGDAFAGRQDAANFALQAAQAYYVGRAAELGQLAPDSQAADAKLVREAVRATVGNVIDYNGEGSVLAPWGMSEDDFEDRAERAVSAKVREFKLEDDADSFGLTNANGDGRFALTLGRRPVLDARGNPIIVDISQADPRDARGYIQR